MWIEARPCLALAIEKLGRESKNQKVKFCKFYECISLIGKGVVKFWNKHGLFYLRNVQIIDKKNKKEKEKYALLYLLIFISFWPKATVFVVKRLMLQVVFLSLSLLNRWCSSHHLCSLFSLLTPDYGVSVTFVYHNSLSSACT